MKILLLFDVARRMDPNQTFSVESLREENKPTEADVLRCLEGLSHAETARAMGLSVKAVEKHVSAAVKALTARLGPGRPG